MSRIAHSGMATVALRSALRLPLPSSRPPSVTTRNANASGLESAVASAAATSSQGRPRCAASSASRLKAVPSANGYCPAASSAGAETAKSSADQRAGRPHWRMTISAKSPDDAVVAATATVTTPKTAASG